MIPRHYLSRLRRLLRNFPIVCILGPRQCGKTTFIKAILPSWQYLDMEKPSDNARMSADPEDTLNRLKTKFVLDEAQQVPDLFPALRSFIDNNPGKAGQLVLLGSASPTLVKHISETLAGRIGFLDMTPFHWQEVKGGIKRLTFEKLWFRGGFPDACLKRTDEDRTDWFDAYSRTFIERDLAAMGIEITAAQMRKLWTMLAHFNGNIWNASKLAASLGISYHTVNRYTDILEQTFLIRKLSPYYANIGKRLVKSPKIYFRDTGLLHYFLNIDSQNILGSHPARGASWETYILEQMLSAFSLYFPASRSYYWRTATGIEVDLIIALGASLIPFEIKLYSSPGRKEANSLLSCMQDLDIKHAYIIYPGKEDYSLGNGIRVLAAENLMANPGRLKKLAG